MNYLRRNFLFLALCALTLAVMQSGAFATDPSDVTTAIGSIKDTAITIVGVLVTAVIAIYLAAFAIPAIKAGFRMISGAIKSLG